jgi:hypothetical protein
LSHFGAKKGAVQDTPGIEPQLDQATKMLTLRIYALLLPDDIRDLELLQLTDLKHLEDIYLHFHIRDG